VPEPSLRLDGRTAIVSGANHGIGSATARLLAERGARVALTYLRLDDEPDPGIPEAYRTSRAASAEPIAEEIRRGGGRAIAIEADLSDPATPAALFDRAEAELGPVDILVNNATGWLADTFGSVSAKGIAKSRARVSAATFDQQFAVDARGAALLIAELARRHSERGSRWGRIVGLISGGPQGFPGEVSYGAAKAALQNYTMSAAFELAPLGITANLVYPPVTDTGWVTDDVREHMQGRPELLRIATPEQVAQQIAYLVSNEAHLITANTLHLR
jgi:3-oxoacyl-[acyl-carrier protein] reductase